jgi:hypothetical protein
MGASIWSNSSCLKIICSPESVLWAMIPPGSAAGSNTSDHNNRRAHKPLLLSIALPSRSIYLFLFRAAPLYQHFSSFIGSNLFRLSFISSHRILIPSNFLYEHKLCHRAGNEKNSGNSMK